MITIDNYKEKVKAVNWDKVPAAKKNRTAVEELFELYGMDDDIDKTINTYLKQISATVKEGGGSGKAKAAKKTGSKPKNLTEFKRYLKENIGSDIYLDSYYTFGGKKENRKETREIGLVQNDSVMFIDVFGKEKWLTFGKAIDWEFSEAFAKNTEIADLTYYYERPAHWSNKNKPVKQKKKTIRTVLRESQLFRYFTPFPQLEVVESSNEFVDIVEKVEKQLRAIPLIDDKDETPIFDLPVYGHYFYGGDDYWILDKTNENDLFGYGILGDPRMGESGWLPLQDIRKSPRWNLDFHWDVKPLGEVLHKAYPNDFPPYKPTAKKPAAKKPAAKKAATKKKAVKKAVNVKFVDAFSEEFKLLRRFLNATKKDVLTFSQIRLLYMAFNKAAVSRTVRKTSDKADEFTQANKGIEKIYGQVKLSDTAKNNGIKLNIENTKLIEDLEKYVSGTKVNYAVTLLRSFIGLQGTKPEVSKAARLLKRFENAIKTDRVDKENRLYDEVKEAIKELKAYVEDPDDKIEVDHIGLSRPAVKRSNKKLKFREVKKKRQTRSKRKR
jgi:hypothetical protein